MRTRMVWTVALDRRLRALRAVGLNWEQIALELDLGRGTVVERGRRIGARPPRRLENPLAMEPCDRPAHPPGHPSTWGLLTQGTILAGQPYPYPVFL
jgi:hypothetical protein